MKKMILPFLLLISCGSIAAQNPVNPSENSGHGCSTPDSLVILWTSKDPEVFHKVVFPYAFNSKKQGWWQNVELLIWGPSAKLLSESQDLQDKVIKLRERGVKLTACKWCADQYDVSQLLKKLGVTVKFMGKPLTDYLKSGSQVLVF